MTLKTQHDQLGKQPFILQISLPSFNVSPDNERAYYPHPFGHVPGYQWYVQCRVFAHQESKSESYETRALLSPEMDLPL